MMNTPAPTIAALSTPPGRGALAVIRLTGDGAQEVFAGVIAEKEKFRKESPRRIGLYTVINTDTDHRTDKYGNNEYIRRTVDTNTGDTDSVNIDDNAVSLHADNTAYNGADNTAIDEVTAVKYDAPRSYTGEEMVEIFCHGGAIIPAKILDALFHHGARAAGRGEFSRRALINGKIGILKAESIMELIESQTETHLRSAQLAYFGKQSESIERLKQEIIAVLSDIESRIEFDEDDDVAESKQQRVLANKKGLITIVARLEDELRRGDRIKALDDGIIVTIAGPANAGKSSLFNEILGYDRSIVHDSPGTTRDIVSERLSFDGETVKLIDSAGLRETGDAVETLGMDRTRSAVAEAHAILWVTSATEAFGEGEREGIIAAATGGTGNDDRVQRKIYEAQDVDIYNNYDEGRRNDRREMSRLVVVINKIDEDDSLATEKIGANGKSTVFVVSVDTNESSNINYVGTNSKDGTILPLFKSYLTEKKSFCEEHGLRYVETSITQKLNRERLFDAINAVIKKVVKDTPSPAIIINERHRGIIEVVVRDIRESMENIDREEIAAHCLRAALDRLSEFSGHTGSDEVLNEIFERFCIGK